MIVLCWLIVTLCRENLTALTTALDEGGFFDESRYKMKYESFVFFPSTSALAAVVSTLLAASRAEEDR